MPRPSRRHVASVPNETAVHMYVRVVGPTPSSRIVQRNSSSASERSRSSTVARSSFSDAPVVNSAGVGRRSTCSPRKCRQ